MFEFSIWLNREQILDYYQGFVTDVVVQATDGTKIQLPLKHFRPYIQHSGIHGHFRLIMTKNGQLERLEKIN